MRPDAVGGARSGTPVLCSRPQSRTPNRWRRPERYRTVRLLAGGDVAGNTGWWSDAGSDIFRRGVLLQAHGHGVGEARIADEEAHVVLPTSYLSDVLGDLLQALGILLEGSPTAECSWEEEPGEYRWVFNSSDDDVALRILAFRNSWPRRPEEEVKSCLPPSARSETSQMRS
jgi:hypothetical protein